MINAPSSPLPGEDSLLALIDRHFPGSANLRGDDCAMLPALGERIVSTDLFIEDAHFRQRYFTFEEIGAKALAVNISDIAGMGGQPRYFSLGLGLSPGVSAEDLDQLLRGMARMAQQHNLLLSGGDLSRASGLVISITIDGEAWPELAGSGLPKTGPAETKAAFLQRRAARPGDSIFCIGQPGLARTGLKLLEERGREAMKEFPLACAAHLAPQPLVQEGRGICHIAQSSGAAERFGLMDVSDGLARDLPRLLGPDCGAALDSSGIRAAEESVRYALARGLDPLTECLLGGEDYALAGSCPPQWISRLQAEIPGCLVLGTVIARNAAQPALSLDYAAFTAPGFDHFA